MSALTLTLKQATAQRVDMAPLSCHLLAGKSRSDIAVIELQSGKRKLRIDELFDISGDDTQNLVIENSNAKLDNIGKDMQGGQITVKGDAGAYLAMGMKSGTVTVTGNAGIFAACEMKNGTVTINGNVGDFLGGALPGNKQGMKGGLVLVKGNVGERCGDHLRRGVILVEGDAGDYCGSRMLAGTIAVLGKTGRYLGYAMNRGTLLLWNTPEIPATFNDCGSHTLAFLPILFASFRNLDSKFAQAGIAFNRAQRYGGDIAATGRGEVLIKL